MIDIACSILLLLMYAIWARDGYANTAIKIVFLAAAIALAVDTAYEMNYIIYTGE